MVVVVVVMMVVVEVFVVPIAAEAALSRTLADTSHGATIKINALCRRSDGLTGLLLTTMMMAMMMLVLLC